MTKAKSRKEIAKTFLRMVATGRVDEAYERFVGAGFRHHNAYYPGDADSLRKGMAEAHGQFPKTSIEIQRALEEGSLVAVHSKVKHKPADLGFAVVHLFRFKGAKIAEFWDVGMEVPKDSPNQHGVF
jgi:predicted SnoaL-like aldol condensation-catalyzing enzyme